MAGSGGGAVVGMTSVAGGSEGKVGADEGSGSAPIAGTAALSSTAANRKPLRIDIDSPDGSCLDCSQKEEFAVASGSSPAPRHRDRSPAASLAGPTGNVT